MITPEILKAYDASRERRSDKSVICHAPFVSLNFDQSGNVTACCFNREFVLGTYPEQTVAEIWAGGPAQELRQAFLTGAVVKGCDRCFDQLKNRNFSGALMRNFDVYAQGTGPRTKQHHELPVALEFEISNTCTLECVMCGGHWSSTIRAKREKLPPIRNPYDAKFVEQIRELIPTMVAARFLGAEPFLITAYYEIWDAIRQLNPDCEISITTSGAVIPDRPKQILEQLRANVIVSLDGITKPTYESVRKNADFDTVMSNIAYLRDYTRRRGTQLTVAVCPMTHNWHEVSAIVDFAEARGVNVFFNTVTFPISSSLAGLPASRLAEVIETLEKQGTAANWSARSRDQWKSLTSQLRGWLEDKQSFLDMAAAEAARGRAVLEPVSSSSKATPQRRSLFGWLRGSSAAAAATGPAPNESAIPDIVNRWIDGVALARCVEHEKSEKPETTELLCRLPPMPLEISAPDGAPHVADLAVAVNVLRHKVPVGVASGSADAKEQIVRENARLGELLRQPHPDAASEARLTSLGDWMRQRIEACEVSVVEQAIANMISGGNWALLLIDGTQSIEAELGLGLEALRSRGYSEPVIARARVYIRSLLEAYAPDGKKTAGVGNEPERAGAVSDLVDVSAALAAMETFDDVFRVGPNHDSLMQRLATIRAAVENGHGDSVLQAMKQGDILTAFRFLANASDAMFAGGLRTLQP